MSGDKYLDELLPGTIVTIGGETPAVAIRWITAIDVREAVTRG